MNSLDDRRLPIDEKATEWLALRKQHARGKYTPPELTAYGSLVELTRGGSTGPDDGQFGGSVPAG